jgi:Zn-dependent alcohol dehydrogenase
MNKYTRINQPGSRKAVAAKICSGAGYVVEVGSKVKAAKVGDPVLLSFASCSTCKTAQIKHPAFCDNFMPMNYLGAVNAFQGESPLWGSFFGQSSFASLAAVKESSVVNVSDLIRDREELKLFAPLGCGYQTGAGTITRLVDATEKDSVAVFGVGGVGMAAIMVSAHYRFTA